MSNIQKFDVIILNTDNDLLPLTINSLKKNTPNWKWSIIQCENNKKVNAVLKNCTRPTIALVSGIICNLNLINLQYNSICNSNFAFYKNKRYTFSKDSNLLSFYNNLRIKANPGIADLSFFILNPFLFNYIPEEDSGFLSKVAVTDMPMNYLHKEDPLIDHAFDAKNCLNYGVKGLSAVCHDYRKFVKTGKCTVAEAWTYNFSRLLQYTDHLNYKYIRNIEQIAKKESDMILQLKIDINEKYLPINNGRCLKSRNSAG